MKLQIEEKMVNRAIRLARKWQDRANELLTPEEKKARGQFKRLLTHPMDKIVLSKLIDQSFRSADRSRVADQVNAVLRHHGVPDFFSGREKLMVHMFLGLGRHLPFLSVPKMIEKMRKDSGRAIIPGEPDLLRDYLKKRKAQGVRINVNHLGEALLGEKEAQKRLNAYIADLKNPDIEYISVKISTIYSQISSLAFDHTVNVLSERLSRLYRTAQAHTFTRHDGVCVPKFVNLDMEAYQDMEITLEAFVRTLEKEALHGVSAGIVLQAYLPDAFPVQVQLTRWAKARIQKGGAPIKLRIVKGANMEMEQVGASISGWPLAPYDNKLSVDASYKQMVTYGMRPENIQAVHLGIASHNLFDLAYAAVLGKANKVAEKYCFEMLEGMADHVRRALAETSEDLLLYAPVAGKEEFINAIGYLVRRLDENTAPENFLRYAPHLATDSSEWRSLEKAFAAACRHVNRISFGPNRCQDRNGEPVERKGSTFRADAFSNEPDTDWSLPANRNWAEEIRSRWMNRSAERPEAIPIVVDGREIFVNREHRESFDPSRVAENPSRRAPLAVFALARQEDIDRAMATAKKDPDGWRTMPIAKRHELLSRVAVELRRARGDLIGSAAANTGKVFSESDTEVSEAIDFAEFYPFSVKAYSRIPHLKVRGKGVGVVISPWNFPIAIPCGGIVASLSAGNTVILKPSSRAVPVAWRLCRCFWEAGISRNILQFLPCKGDKEGRYLTEHPSVDYVILTGGTDTGMDILRRRPDMLLAAETGGKNATIVTAMADRDQAIENIIYSAFGNSGQKCSATSLLILEREVYKDPDFKSRLVDAAQSVAVGSAWDFENRMSALIKPPGDLLMKAMTRLEPGESWALKPEMIDGNPLMWSPGIKWGVTPGSLTHLTEFFGPILGVMPADDLDHAIELANGTGYGLTSGLESLDHREQERWRSAVRAGNLYINRGTTGAINLRQPFGGMGKSAIGPGIKAGGPDYVTQFMDYEETGFPRIDLIGKAHPLLRLTSDWQCQVEWGGMKAVAGEIDRTIRGVRSYLYHYQTYFSLENDFFHLRGQDNLLRYLPAGRVVVRLHREDSLFEILARIAAARICRCRVQVSIPESLESAAVHFLLGREGRRLAGDAKIVTQTSATLAAHLPRIDRIRYAAPDRVEADVMASAAAEGFHVSRGRVLMEGRIELLHYLTNQSICHTYHRYGNLGERGLSNT